MNAGHPDRRINLLAALQDDTVEGAFLCQDPFDACLGSDLTADGLGGTSHCPGDSAHATLGISPVDDVALAAAAAYRVVQQDVRRPGLIRSSPLPDEPVDHHDRLDLFGLEPT